MYKRDKTIWCLTEEAEVNFVVINEQTSKRLFEKEEESTPDLSKGSQGFSNKALRVSPLLETLIFFFFPNCTGLYPWHNGMADLLRIYT